jgi:hypothetical protein
MVIPKQIKIGKSRYKITVVEQMPIKGDMGRTYYAQNEIMIGRSSNPTRNMYTARQFNETFWHEVTHAVLHEMDSPLAFNEKFVEHFAYLLANAILSAKFK